jgi:hypothetical protein
MYAATTGTFLQRDPIGDSAAPVLEYSHESITKKLRSRGRNAWASLQHANLYEYA